jgi:hypothetical protein
VVDEAPTLPISSQSFFSPSSVTWGTTGTQDLILEVGLENCHHHDSGRNRVGVRCRREPGQDPVVQGRVNDKLAHFLLHLMCQHTKIHAIAASVGFDDDLLLALVRDEVLAELFGVCVDV